jgi:hypothetical protein
LIEFTLFLPDRKEVAKMAFITSSIKWITDAIGYYWFPTPELTGSQIQVTDHQQIYSPDAAGSQQLTVLPETEYQAWINFEVTGSDRMEVDYDPQRGVKRLLDDDDETWSLSRKQPMSPESKRIRMCDFPKATTRPFVSKWNRKAKNQKMRKLGRRRRVSISVCPRPSSLVVPVQLEPMGHGTCFPREYPAMMPVIQQQTPMMPSMIQPSNDVVLVDSEIVPKNRKPNNQRGDRTKNKVGAIYTAKKVNPKGK